MVDTLVVEAQDGDGLIGTLLLGPCEGDSHEGQADYDLKTETAT